MVSDGVGGRRRGRPGRMASGSAVCLVGDHHGVVEPSRPAERHGRYAMAEDVVGQGRRRGPRHGRLDGRKLGALVGARWISAVGQTHGFSSGRRGRSGRACVAAVIQRA